MMVLKISSCIINFMSRPLTLLKFAFVLFLTWTELVKVAMFLHFNLVWKLLTLPLRLLTAIWRERQLEMRLHDVQCELENLVCDRKQLELHLRTAIREHKMMELLLEDLEHEHDSAISMVQLLQDELQELKNENLRMLEVQGKGYWNFTSKDDGNRYGIQVQAQTETELLKHLKPESNNGVVDHRRGAAITQSLSSAVLSLLVGMIIWNAEDPCMPLVVALFTVVGMSLKTVVQFFSTIKNKPASDSVALLSLNWFILGTLTYPTLPVLARMLSPVALRIVNGAASLTGLSFT
ncbi:uncharacterized protein LOC133801504 isoform X1 [Humulus lupulus]|uniref:uncharacterized protein LOC133801504 isoform X1 n=1 Tax=Humulus lupulus TaxID=3486 RepID=UPI002B40B82E|nr:uncharacterized protein LOC133801504 isoform X1 [Humulus lupulus]XP_062095711.1 uncharacterized protein LOC133801504 isoform X1 [Humulus lupulus]